MLKNKNVCTVVFVVFLSIFFLEFLNNKKPKHPDAGLNIVELLTKYDYPVETHEVVTEDGYILTVHRIPHSREKNQIRRRPVLFMHGLAHSGVDFVVLGPGKALALLLADQGFDIWLAHARGTTWSRKHQTLDPDRDREFWDFSLHEIGSFDVPALIDHILTVTGYSDLHYVGFSQGTIAFFILTSERPEYAHKVKLMTALAPAVFIKSPRGPILTLFVYFRGFIKNFFNIFNVREFLSKEGLLGFYLRVFCNKNSIFVNFCLVPIYSTQGFNIEGTNKTMLSLIYSNAPAGMSTKQLLHVLQLMGTGIFQQYDLGTEENLRKYGQEEPPTYQLSTAVTPVALYYATNDWPVNIENIEKVQTTLPNVVKSYHVPLDRFNHDDFIRSDDAPRLVYGEVIEEILQHN